MAGLGYGLSALGKVALVAAGNTIGGVGAIVAVDRVGKGIRTAPRDALISLSSAKDKLATSFGVHRAMDSVGAMLGPLIAFGILFLAPARFDAVFVVSTLFAILGLAVLVLNVEGKPRRAPREGTPPRLRAAASLLKDRSFAPLLLAAAGLSIASVSDAMIYVGLQRTIDFEPAVFPLLYVMTAISFMALAIPVGQLADRIGKVPVLLAGQALLFVVYGVLLMTSVGYLALIVCLVCPRRLLRRDRRRDDGAGGRGAAGEAAGERDRDTDHRGQPRSPGLLARLRRALVRDRAAQRGPRSSPSPWRWRSRLAAPLLLRAQRRRSGWIGAAARSPSRLVVACVLLGGGYVVYAALGPSQTTTDASPSAGKSPAGTAVMVRAVDPSSPALNGGVFVVEDGKVRRRSKDLACERVYYAAGHGICMGVASSGVDYTATVFDGNLQPQHSMRLTGLPSRARVSADGRYGAMTVFVSGDAYLYSSDRLLDPHLRARHEERRDDRAAGAVRGQQGRQAVRRGRFQLLGDHLRP